MNEESPRLLSIGEFARRSRLSVSALRFYGDCGLITPARVDAWTGYRSYAESQLREAELVRQLRLLEMPIVEIRAILTGNAAAGRASLDFHWRRLERRRERSRHALAEAQRLLDSREDHVPDMPATATLDAHDIAQAIRQVLPAAGPLRNGEYPAAVLVEVREDGLRLVATDAHRLAVRDLAAPTQGGGAIPVAATDASKLIDRLPSSGSVEVAVRRDEFDVKHKGSRTVLPRVADHYPDYEAVLRRVGDARLIVQASELKARLDRKSEVVVLHLGPAASTVGETSIASEYRGPELTIGFNPSFLADALESGIGDDVVIQLGGPLDPALIASADDGTFTVLVMPIRLKEAAPA